MRPEHAPFHAAHHDGKAFFNPWGVRANRGLDEVLRWQLQTNPFKARKRQSPELPVHGAPLADFAALPEGGRVLWLGHATVLVEIDGVTALIDPVFDRIGGVVPRFAPSPVGVDALPPIDVVLLSHGHRDHLDLRSLDALGRRFGPDLRFVTPLGLSRALPASCPTRVELDWWQSVAHRGVDLHLVPAQHWHQRTPWDRNQALWGGWVIRGSRSLYHSGDTGYFGGFAAIGAAFPGLDVAVLPMGAYEPRWFMGEQHMSPDGSVQALLDLGATHLVAMHWGTFDLTDEPLDHGVTELLPELVDAAGVDRDRVHVLAHGGSLGFADGPREAGRVGL